MIPTKKYFGSVLIKDGKIQRVDLSLPDEPLSEIRQIMALKHILDNYVKEYEREPERRR